MVQHEQWSIRCTTEINASLPPVSPRFTIAVSRPLSLTLNRFHRCLLIRVNSVIQYYCGEEIDCLLELLSQKRAVEEGSAKKTSK